MPVANSPNFSPRRAVVTPRARKAHGGAALPVEQLVRSLLAVRARGFVVLTGSPGIGKTTALQHLAITLPQDAPVTFLDEPRADEIAGDRRDRLTIMATSNSAPKVRAAAEYELAGWSEDDFVEYLAARHRNRCASVLARLHADAECVAIG